jgi:TP901 family phage tail tape measure protein
MEASNARVLAFGASAGAIYALGAALVHTVKSAISVEKSLKDINVILSLSAGNLAKFGDSLFKVASNTGQSFATVADAAVELSRQGLGVEATLKRLSDAMILSRLSGLSAKSSVEALTAALNSFSRSALTSTEVLNKMAAVDAAFAVSSQDLAEGIKRVASTAATAGVSIDELMSLITAAQQITARGGNVIGNSFKTIFTRIQRPRVLEALQGLGIQVKNTSGVLLPLITILKNLSKTYDSLTQAQQASIAELVGGVFQINILKATMQDLGNTNSIFAQSMRIAGNASSEANKRNRELNQTLSAKLNKTLQNLTKTAAAVGDLTLGPLIKNITGGLNMMMESEGDMPEWGQKLGKGLLEGIGHFISGPGMAILMITLTKLFGKLASFSKDAFSGISGITTASQRRANIEKQILTMLQQEPALVEGVRRGVLSVDQLHRHILQTQRAENLAMATSITLARDLAAAMATGGSPRPRPRAGGYVPRYQKTAEEKSASRLGAGNVTSFQGPGKIGGKPYIMNSGEVALSVPWSNEPAVLPTYGSVGRRTGEELARGFAIAADGWIPRYGPRLTPGGKTSGFKDQEGKSWRFDRKGMAQNMHAVSNKIGYASMLVPKVPGQKTSGQLGFGQKVLSDIKNDKDQPYYASFPVHTYNEKNVVGSKKKQVQDVANKMKNHMMSEASKLANSITLPPGERVDKNKIKPLVEKEVGGAKGAIAGAAGIAFEAGMKASLGFRGQKGAASKEWADFDLRGKGQVNKNVRALFGLPSQVQLADYKIAASDYTMKSMANKVVKEGLTGTYRGSSGLAKQNTQKETRGRKRLSRGWIPRYQDAHGEEVRGMQKQLGVSRSQASKLVYTAIDNRITQNPMGLGVFNRIHEPDGPGGMSNGMIKRGMANKKAGGYVPRYQMGGVDTGVGALAGIIAGLSTQFMFLGALMGNMGAEVEKVTRAHAESTSTLEKHETALNEANQTAAEGRQSETKIETESGKTKSARKVIKKKIQKHKDDTGSRRGAAVALKDDPDYQKAKEALKAEAHERRKLKEKVAQMTGLSRKSVATSEGLNVAKDKLRTKIEAEGAGTLKGDVEEKKGAMDAATAKQDKQQKFQSRMMGFTMALGMAQGMISQFGDATSQTTEVMQAVASAGMAAMTVMMVLPNKVGMVGGALVGITAAAVMIKKAFSRVTRDLEKTYDIVKDKNARLVESIDGYIQATDRLSSAQQNLATPAATVLKLQKLQMRSIQAITDVNLKNAILMAATPQQRADAAADAKYSAQQQQGQMEWALNLGKFVEKDVQPTFGFDLGKPGVGLGSKDPFGLGNINLANLDFTDDTGGFQAGAADDASKKLFKNFLLGINKANQMAREFLGTMDQASFDKLMEETMAPGGPGGIGGAGVDMTTLHHTQDGVKKWTDEMVSANAMTKEQALQLQNLAAQSENGRKTAVALIEAIMDNAKASAVLAERERALAGVREGLANAAKLAADAAAAADANLRDATDAFFMSAKAAADMSINLAKMRRSMLEAGTATQVAFAQERLKTASPRLGRRSREDAEYNIKKVQFQAKALKEQEDIQSKTRGKMGKGIGDALKSQMKKFEQKAGEPVDPVKRAKQLKVMQAMAEYQKLEARKESMDPAAYGAALQGLLTGAQFREIMPNILGLKQGIVDAVNSGTNEIAQQSIEIKKQQDIMEQARREQLKRIQADEDATKMGGIKAFLDPKSMSQAFASVQKESAALAMGGGKIAKGQAAMKLAMQIKDLTGAKSVSQLGGLGEIAIEGRAEQIKNQSKEFATLMRKRAAQTNDPKVRSALLAAADQADANAARATDIAKEQVDRELKLENAALDQVALLGQIVGILGGQAADMGAAQRTGNAAQGMITTIGGGGQFIGMGGPADPTSAAWAAAGGATAQQQQAQQIQSGVSNASQMLQQIHADAQAKEDTTGSGRTLNADWIKTWGMRGADGAGDKALAEAASRLAQARGADVRAGLPPGTMSEQTKAAKKAFDEINNNFDKIRQIWDRGFNPPVPPPVMPPGGLPLLPFAPGGAPGGGGMPVVPGMPGIGGLPLPGGPGGGILPKFDSNTVSEGVADALPYASPAIATHVTGWDIDDPIKMQVPTKTGAPHKPSEGDLTTKRRVGAVAAGATMLGTGAAVHGGVQKAANVKAMVDATTAATTAAKAAGAGEAAAIAEGVKSGFAASKAAPSTLGAGAKGAGKLLWLLGPLVETIQTKIDPKGMQQRTADWNTHGGLSFSSGKEMDFFGRKMKTNMLTSSAYNFLNPINTIKALLLDDSDKTNWEARMGAISSYGGVGNMYGGEKAFGERGWIGDDPRVASLTHGDIRQRAAAGGARERERALSRRAKGGYKGFIGDHLGLGGGEGLAYELERIGFGDLKNTMDALSQATNLSGADFEVKDRRSVFQRLRGVKAADGVRAGRNVGPMGYKQMMGPGSRPFEKQPQEFKDAIDRLFKGLRQTGSFDGEMLKKLEFAIKNNDDHLRQFMTGGSATGKNSAAALGVEGKTMGPTLRELIQTLRASAGGQERGIRAGIGNILSRGKGGSFGGSLGSGMIKQMAEGINRATQGKAAKTKVQQGRDLETVKRLMKNRRQGGMVSDADLKGYFNISKKGKEGNAELMRLIGSRVNPELIAMNATLKRVLVMQQRDPGDKDWSIIEEAMLGVRQGLVEQHTKDREQQKKQLQERLAKGIEIADDLRGNVNKAKTPYEKAHWQDMLRKQERANAWDRFNLGDTQFDRAAGGGPLLNKQVRMQNPGFASGQGSGGQGTGPFSCARASCGEGYQNVPCSEQQKTGQHCKPIPNYKPSSQNTAGLGGGHRRMINPTDAQKASAEFRTVAGGRPGFQLDAETMKEAVKEGVKLGRMINPTDAEKADAESRGNKAVSQGRIEFGRLDVEVHGDKDELVAALGDYITAKVSAEVHRISLDLSTAHNMGVDPETGLPKKPMENKPETGQ